MTELFERRSTNLGRLLFRGYRAINAALLDGLRAEGHDGLRLGHVGVLSNLDLTTGTRQVVLAERAGITKQAVGQVVRELEQLGYAETSPDPADGRAKLVSLTPVGRRVINDAQPIIGRLEEAIAGDLGDGGLAALTTLLNRLLAGFDEGEAHPRA